MSQTLNIEVPDAITEAWRILTPNRQQTLVQFAQFLKTQELAESLEPVDEAEEAEWDKLFADPEKMANLDRMVDKALAEDSSQPLDPSQL